VDVIPTRSFAEDGVGDAILKLHETDGTIIVWTDWLAIPISFGVRRVHWDDWRRSGEDVAQF